jgi:iron complex outermembrane recepter protein
MRFSRVQEYKMTLSVAALLALPVPLAAQDTSDKKTQNGEIVVTAARIKGSVETDVPPIEEIDEKDIASYGASSLTDLIAAVAPQTGSGRGRGGGQPVILLNGQRISGFRELRDLPPEAVKRVQIFPEEVALKYGYKPDQRVINFILKDNFASFSGEVEAGVPQDGGFSRRQVESNLTRIGASSRFNLNIEYETASRLTEDERSIIASPATALFTLADGSSDIGAFRSLLPQTERFEVNSTWSKAFAPQTTLALNANYKLEGSRSLLGLPSASILVPGSSTFSLSGADMTLNRYFNTPRALERKGTTGTAQFGVSFNTLLGGWRMAFTGDYASIDSNVISTRNADFTALRAGVLAGTINPYAANFGNNLVFLVPDQTDSLSHTLNLLNTFSGSVFRLPAGDVQMTLRTGFARQTLDSSGITSSAVLKRSDLNGSLSIEVPVIERGVGALGFLGDIAVNGNYGLSDLSDFGRLIEYGAGIRWSPVKGVSLQASLIGDENAPGIGQLGSPNLLTPSIAYYDFVTGQTSLINVISGGNPALIGEKRRDIKLSVGWSPAKIQGMSLQIEYFKNNSRNTTASFPLLTPEIEAAFPGRVTRDISGRLTSIDQRPVNFDRERSQSIRTGFNMSGGIGKQPQGGTTSTGGRGSGRGGGFGGGPGGGGLGALTGAPPSRWQIALTHTYRIQQDILIRAGVPVLDLLNGSAISTLGGAARHEVELSGGVFTKGIGLRATGNYRSATTANGSGLPGSSDLTFSDLTTLNLRLFVSLDNRGSLTKKLPFLKGSRIAFEIQNVLNDVIDVRDQNGLVPLSYQPGYLDPRGRFFELSFRKRF